jgi:hypothetical protein
MRRLAVRLRYNSDEDPLVGNDNRKAKLWSSLESEEVSAQAERVLQAGLSNLRLR